MSYDSPEQLQTFANEYDVTYNLFSDDDSAVIREFGILNTLISPDDSEQAAGRSLLEIDRRVLSLGGVVTVLSNAAGRAAGKPETLRGGRNSRLRREL